MKRIFWLIVPAIFLIMQLFNPSFKNPSVDPALDFEKVANPPAELLSTLKTACYDCHSNETKWPWYSKIAPVSWWVNNHVQEGREKLNFSEYGSPQTEGGEEIAEVIQEGEMPMPSYTYLGMHAGAKLNSTQKSMLINWFNQNGVEGKGQKEGSSDKDDD